MVQSAPQILTVDTFLDSYGDDVITSSVFPELRLMAKDVFAAASFAE